MKLRRLASLRLLAITAALSLGAAVVWAAAPLAGTIIGNAASATYKDNANVDRQVTSNVVTTVVQQVYGFTLVADRTASVAPGGQVFFPHTLTNTGNGSDSYVLSVANRAGDNFDLTSLRIYADVNQDGIPDDTTDLAAAATSLPLGAGGEFHFVVVGTAPGTAAAGQSSAIDVTATPAAAGQTPATNLDTATVTAHAVIAVTKTISRDTGAVPADAAASTADPLTYTLTYTNTGNTAATSLTLTDVIPTNLIYVAGSATWSGTSGTITDAAAGDPSGIVYDYNITTATRVTAVIAVVNPGASGTLTFRVRVNPGIAPQTINNTARYSYDPGTGTPTTDVPTNTVPYTVTQTIAVALGASSAATNLETPANASPEIYTVASANPGSTVTFVNRVYNLGNGTDTFDLTLSANTFPTGTTFSFYKADGNTPLVDTDGNGTPDTGPLAPAATYDVVIKAILPTNAPTGGPRTLTAQATSVSSAAVTNTVIDQLTSVISLYVDLTNNAPASDAGTQLGENPTPAANTGEATAVVTNTADPGTTTRFTLHAYNPTTIPDAYDISSNVAILFNGNPAPTGWTIVFRDATTDTVITSTGLVAAGGNKKFYADVTIPAGTTPGTTDIYYRVQSPTTGVSDIIHDAVTVNAIRALSLTPNHTGQTYPGGVVFYDHLLTNQGNVTEGAGATGSLIALSLGESLSAQGWNSVVYYDANNNGAVDTTESVVTASNFATLIGGLAPSQSVGLIVKVFAPAGAPNLASNVTTLTATTTDQINTGNYSGAEPATVSVTDTTTVVLGDLTITKKQSSTNGSGYATAQLNRQPGQTIYYELTVTNTGSANSTEVFVYDTTPAYTTYDATNGPVTITVVTGSLPSTPTSTAPANGSAGDFSFSLGSLPPGAVVKITFGVKINQ